MRAKRVTAKVRAIANRLGCSVSTVWKWKQKGCNINSPKSVQQFLLAGRLPQKHDPVIEPNAPPTRKFDGISADLSPVGRRGAAAALERLEQTEERAHARLLRAIEADDPFKLRAAGEFYLKSSEVLRRLDLAVEVERRAAGEQVPKKQIEHVSWQISEWLRGAFMDFLSSESVNLMELDSLGEFKAHCIDRFKGLLHTTVKTSLKTNNPIPSWAAAQVIEAWNVSAL